MGPRDLDVTTMMDNDEYDDRGSYRHPKPAQNVPAPPKGPDAGRTFHPFPKLPAELRRMIWREFYLEPRYFIAGEDSEASYGEDSPLPLDQDQWHFSREFTQRMTPYSRCARYWRAIDTAIDCTSREVARGLRGRVWFPTWAFAFKGDDDGAWVGSLPWRDPAKNPQRGYQYPSDVRINWDTDWINLSYLFEILCSGDLDDPSVVSSPKLDWWANIQNLAVPWNVPDYGIGDRSVTVPKMNLWVCCQKMPALTAVRGLLQPLRLPAATPRVVDLCASVDYFQRLHLLRLESCANEHIRRVRLEITCKMPGITWPPSWSRVRVLLSGVRFRNEFEEDWAKIHPAMVFEFERDAERFAEVELSEDEVEGSEQLFRELDLEPIQVAVRGLDDWIEYERQFLW
ncbi:hypothetical protein CPLU01_07889 [Colletotrichum plurivorum]|uniref:2EXR domain-containing protein n=1 Tax=Colletotrichum plurivorum TaxID=2175906 RepID=A0A8H6KDW6_9PEZI|nr:hypothetical protein CPLU01_07889 [Colletotrichum plurivorum]